MNFADIESVDTKKVKRLYHYQRFESQWISNLVNYGCIKFSAPNQFNDPWDCRLCYDSSFLNEPSKAESHMDYFIQEWLHKNPGKENMARVMADMWRSDSDMVRSVISQASDDMEMKISSRYRVYCLTPKPDCQLMWAHYAQSHTGVCIEFSTQDHIIGSALRVNYLEEFPAINFIDGKRNTLAFVAKSLVWSYEEEYRILAEERGVAEIEETFKTDGDFITLPEGAVTAIVAGCKISPKNYEELEKILNGTGVALKRAKLIPDKYSLAIV